MNREIIIIIIIIIIMLMIIWVPAHLGLGEIYGLLVPPGKASKLLTDHLITGYPLKFEPARKKWLSQTICLGGYISEAHFECWKKGPIK